MSDVVNNSNIDCRQGNTTCHISPSPSVRAIYVVLAIAMKAVNITLIFCNVYIPVPSLPKMHVSKIWVLSKLTVTIFIRLHYEIKNCVKDTLY